MRIPTIPTTTSDAQIAPLYAAVKTALGVVPNMVQTIGNSPAALNGYLALSGALAKGHLPAVIRERLALTMAEFNGCDYCLAAHSLLSKRAGLDATEAQRARLGTSQDPYAAAVLTLARSVARAHGKIDDGDLAAARRAGLDDAAIIEVVAHVALNVLTNYMNNVSQTTLDFPAAPALSAQAV